MVEGSYSVVFEESPQEGLASFRRNGFDLVIIKPHTLDSGSLELIKEFKSIDQDCVIIAYLEVSKPEILEYLPALCVAALVQESFYLINVFGHSSPSSDGRQPASRNALSRLCSRTCARLKPELSACPFSRALQWPGE